MELRTLKDTQSFSKKISNILKKGDIIFLYGEIGVGKTTFVRFLINNLQEENGVKRSEVLSPTFNIVYDYDIKKIKILHYDLYRLKNYNDILETLEKEKSNNTLKGDLIKSTFVTSTMGVSYKVKLSKGI